MINLPIKRKWFDMILSGIKKEEYREIKPFYISRLEKYIGSEPFHVKFINSRYNKGPSFTALVTAKKGTGNPEWGAEPGVEYYILSILSVEK